MTERKRKKEEVKDANVQSRMYLARMSSPDIPDGYINSMPATSIDACFVERITDKARILGKSKNVEAAASDVQITPRLSEKHYSRVKKFSFEYNATNCSYMDRYREAMPERHLLMT